VRRRSAHRWFMAVLGCALGLSPAAGILTAGAAPLSDADQALNAIGKQIQDPSLRESDRIELIKTLATWGGPQVRAPLEAALGDPLPSIRAAAARALGSPGNREAVPALRARVESPGETGAVRAAALESLGKIGDETVRPLVLAATKDPDGAVRRAALWSLTFGSLASPSDRVPFLRQAAEDRDVDLLTRCQAIAALGEARDKDSTDLFVRLLEQEPPIPNPMPPRKPSQQEIMMMRYREARDVRGWSARALGQIEAKSATPLLLRSAEDPDDFFLRLISVRVLAAWATPEALEVFERRLDDPAPDVRAAALIGISRIGNRAAVDSVLTRLSDTAPAVRVQAVITLGDLGDPRVRPQLEAMRGKDPDPGVNQVLVESLARLPH